jgi:hypothetical protein
MATRLFCDHCGNCVTSVNKFCFGEYPKTQFLPQQGGGYGVAPPQLVPPQGGMQAAFRVDQLTVVDLCNTCGPIWMRRVANITKVSDPDVQPSKN